jgi:hypothetical protein
VAIDGSKFRAANGRDRNFSTGKIKRRLQEIDEKIERYLQEVEENGRKEERIHKPSAKEIQEKIEYLRKRRKELRGLEK